MSARSIRFRVESNKSKNTFWYTLVSSNGNTTMTSKTTYRDRATAKRAAVRQIKALLGAALELEYEHDGQMVRKPVEVVVSMNPIVQAGPFSTTT